MQHDWHVVDYVNWRCLLFAFRNGIGYSFIDENGYVRIISIEDIYL